MGSSKAVFDLQQSFTHRLHSLHKLTDRVSQNAYRDDAGMPLAEGRCLAAVGAFAPLSVNDLARAANLDKGQASRAAQSLVKQGLVSKTASPADGRGVVLTLTADGNEAWQRVMAVIERRNGEILDCLSREERRQFEGLLDRLVEHARLAVGEKSGDDGSSKVATSVAGRRPQHGARRS